MSSSSALLTRQPVSTPRFSTTSVDCFPHMSMQSNVDYEEDDRKGEIYDPFSPTDGDKDRRMVDEEEEGEKYDPFDPTGSPASDVDDEIEKEREVATNAEVDDEVKAEEPPDSTDTFTDQLSPCPASQLPLRRRVESSAPKSKEHKQGFDSDHSEIEEGEIVTALDKDGTNKRPSEKVLSVNSPHVSFFGSKPERILRVLDGDGFVSVCTEENWEDDKELEIEPTVGVEDLRRKLVSRRKEKYHSFPATSPLSAQPAQPPSLSQTSRSSSPLMVPVEQPGKTHKSSKSSNDHDQQKSIDRKPGDKEARRKKRRKGKEGEREKSKEKERGHKAVKEVKTRRSSRSSSRKRKKRRHSSPDASHNSSRRRGHSRRSFSSLSEERQREREREKDKDRNRDRGRSRERDKERHHHYSSSHRKDERVRDSSSRKRERERTDKRLSRSRERDISKRSRRSLERRDSERERQYERERRRDGRPVVPPSIQDLNGSDLFAIKRTITVTTTTTTTTVPGSPRLTTASPSHPTQVEHSLKRKKRKWHSVGEAENQESCRSQSQSPSPSRYRGYESDHYSDKLEIDMLSLDGEALDSDYPSLEDTPPPALPPDPPVPSPKVKTPTKPRRNHPKKKSNALKKSESSSSSNRTTSKCLSSLTVTSGSASADLPSDKRGRKMGKDKDRDKGNRKDLSHSGKSKKESGSGRKGKLQSKVSVMVREGVSSTTGSSVGSGKLSMDLLGPGSTGGGTGGSVVGGSIAVVFCRDNESRSPFLKPCSELLSLGSRSKDLSSMGKRSSLAAPPSTLASSAVLKPKKTKTSSITSTSSSASSPSSSLATKRRRRLAKKTSKKSGGVGLAAGNSNQTKALSEGWGGVSLDVQSASGEGSKSVSPHTVQAGPPPCSSSSSTSSSTSALPPSTSPPRTPPPSTAPLRDIRESSPDSQTVDSSCKTPDPSFLAEDCPTQTSPIPPVSSPSSLSIPQGAGLNNVLSTPTAKPPPTDDASKSLASPPCSSSSAGLSSFSLPLSSSDLSSSSSVSSSSASKLLPPPPPPPPPAASALPWSLQTGVDCTTGGVLARKFPCNAAQNSKHSQL